MSPGPERQVAAGDKVVSGEAPKGAPGASWAKMEVLISTTAPPRVVEINQSGQSVQIYLKKKVAV